MKKNMKKTKGNKCIELESVFIYGAGKGCDALFSEYNIGEKYFVKGIIDSDRSKRSGLYSIQYGNILEKFNILSPEDLTGANFDKIIIAVRQSWVFDIYRLISSKGIEDENILFYDRDNNIIKEISEVKFELCEKEIEMEYYVKQIQFSMLCDYFLNGEFIDCNKIEVIGSKKDTGVIKDFFLDLAPNTKVVCMEKIDKTRKYDKSIFVSSNYMEQVKEYEALYEDKKWLILPIYDVDKYIR